MNSSTTQVPLSLFVSVVSVAQINLDPLRIAVVRNGLSFTVPFQIGTIFNAVNTFSVELSDNGGSFASPTNVGNMVGTTAGTITCIGIGADGRGIAYVW